MAIPKILALGLLLTGALSLPPLEFPQRLDRALFDLWTRLGPPRAPGDILVVKLYGAESHAALLDTAVWQSARLVVTTLADKPQLMSRRGQVLGPVAVATSAMPILRETAWRRGGYLWTRADLDGVVRFERPSIGDVSPTPSLALAAAGTLAAAVHAEPHPPAAIGVGSAATDPFGRRWLRFFGADAFVPIALEEVSGEPNALTDKIVIAGSADAPRYDTPIGPLTPAELTAHTLAGYLTGQFVATTRWLDAAGWLLAVLCIAGIVVKPLDRAWAFGVPAGAAAGLLTAAAAAFVAGGVWIPVAAPALLVLALSGLAVAKKSEKSTRPRNVAAGGETLADARELTAQGALEQSWAVYRKLPMRQDLLAEIYELADALGRRGEDRLAADLFHRIAQADATFRDVTRRLVAAAARPEKPPPDIDAPAKLGRYQILGLIGSGAMGVVYLGRDPAINRIVAIKAIHFDKEFDPAYADEARGRFVREAETAGRLGHPSIVTIHDVGEEDGIAYIAMEYVCGSHLSNHAEPRNLLPVPLVLELVARAADALGYAHSQNVVHRDIKPANIMYDSATDSLKITDFGIARLMDVSRTRTGIVLGTPSYMSPEQLQGENVNGHTDLFALGVSLYQLLTGHLPFRGTSMTQLMFVITNEPHMPVTATRADLPPMLDDIMDRALAKQPAERFSTGGEMARALRAVPAASGA